MSDLIDRTRTPEVVEQPISEPVGGRRPPPHRPPTTDRAPTPWPRRAITSVVALGVVALVMAVAAVVGFTTGDGSSDPELEETIATLTVERDDLLAQISTGDETLATLTAERDGLLAQIATGDEAIATLTAERDGLLAQIATGVGMIATLSAERDDLAADAAFMQTTIDTLFARRQALVTELLDLEAQVQLQTDRASEAIEARDTLLSMFPITVASELTPGAAAGTYDVDVDQAYVSGFSTTLPVVDELTLRATDGRLELVMAGFPVPGVAELDGVLYAVMDVAVTEPCATSPRIARTTMTIFADDVRIATDGTQTITSLGASMTMHAPATASCPVSTAVSAMQLTPQA